MAGRKLARTSHTPVCACCRYVVKPMTGRADVKPPERPGIWGFSRLLALKLEPLKATHPFPVGHRRIERGQFHTRIVEVVLDDVVAERLTRDLRFSEQRGGLGERGGQSLRAAGICIALQR